MSRAERIVELYEIPVEVAVGVPGQVEGDLLAEEEEALGRAARKRREDFTAGRVLARRALAALGAPDGPLARRDDRAPAWPTGFVGSLTHTHGLCAAVVARADDARSLGIDGEPGKPLRDELVARIASEAERANLAASGLDAGVAGRLVFSAKEAFYKAQRPLTGRFLEFGDVEIDLAPRADGVGTFTVRVRLDDWELEPPAGRWAVVDDWVVTTACYAPR